MVSVYYEFFNRIVRKKTFKQFIAILPVRMNSSDPNGPYLTVYNDVLRQGR